jgi:hypothetical protein
MGFFVRVLRLLWKSGGCNRGSMDSLVTMGLYLWWLCVSSG